MAYTPHTVAISSPTINSPASHVGSKLPFRLETNPTLLPIMTHSQRRMQTYYFIPAGWANNIWPSWSKAIWVRVSLRVCVCVCVLTRVAQIITATRRNTRNLASKSRHFRGIPLWQSPENSPRTFSPPSGYYPSNLRPCQLSVTGHGLLVLKLSKQFMSVTDADN